jgi:hypothetical protein
MNFSFLDLTICMYAFYNKHNPFPSISMNLNSQDIRCLSEIFHIKKQGQKILVSDIIFLSLLANRIPSTYKTKNYDFSFLNLTICIYVFCNKHNPFPSISVNLNSCLSEIFHIKKHGQKILVSDTYSYHYLPIHV